MAPGILFQIENAAHGAASGKNNLVFLAGEVRLRTAGLAGEDCLSLLAALAGTPEGFRERLVQVDNSVD